jgi:hypothetical protein
MNSYMDICEVLQEQERHFEKVKGKKTPFRCVFKGRYGYTFTYHETYDDAVSARWTSCGYTAFGVAWTAPARKLRIEVQGPRGGWKKYKAQAKARGQ